MEKKHPNILALEISEGNVESFNFFYRLEFDNIVYFANSYLNDLFKAKDIAQESFLTLWEKRSTIDQNKNLRAFIFTIAKNKALNELKSQARYACSIDINEINANISALSDHSLNAEIESLSLEELINRTMDNLPDTTKESFIMSRRLGMTNKEIAQARNISITGVEYHIKISLKIFKEKLKEYLPFGVLLFLGCI